MRRNFFETIARAPDGEGAPAVATADVTSNASLLFPNETPKGEPEKPSGDETKPADKPAGDAEKPADAKGDDWKEFVPDPSKSETENAAAKAEHDKTKPAPKADDPADKVPEDGDYSAILKMPDGVEVDKELLAEIGPEFKSLGLTGKQAQGLADKFIAVQTARSTKLNESWTATQEKWIADAKSDKEYGGDKWPESQAIAQRAVHKLGTPELHEYFRASGAGNHPEVIRFMTKVGGMIAEDSPPQGGAGGQGGPVDVAHKLFPNDAPTPKG